MSIFNERAEQEVQAWAQGEFDRCRVISADEVAWRLNHAGVVAPSAHEAAQEVLASLTPPRGDLMERWEGSDSQHTLLNRLAYAWLTRRCRLGKVWVGMELPGRNPSLGEERLPPSVSTWEAYPHPDIYAETSEGRFWIECQTRRSWNGLMQKLPFVSHFAGAFDTFVIVGPRSDERITERFQAAALAAGRRFLRVIPEQEPMDLPEDVLQDYRSTLPSVPDLPPRIGVDRFWEFAGMGRHGELTERRFQRIPRPVGETSIPVSVEWPVDCELCSGRGGERGGQSVACPRCSGDGFVEKKANWWDYCRRCWGSGRVPETPCHTCNGRGWHFADKQVMLRVGPDLAGPTDYTVAIDPEGRPGRRGRLTITVAYE